MKFEPVRWMTWVLVILSALAGTTALVDVLPVKVVGAGSVAIAVLTAILGAITRDKVTPVAKPRDEAGVPLVPVRRDSGGY